MEKAFCSSCVHSWAIGEAPATYPKGAKAAGTLQSSCRDIHSLCLTLKIKGVENRNKDLEVQAMNVRIRSLKKLVLVASTPVSVNQNVSFPAWFDVRKHIVLVLPFHESEVDSCFRTFPHIAFMLHWSKDFWSLLLQICSEKLVFWIVNPYFKHTVPLSCMFGLHVSCHDVRCLMLALALGRSVYLFIHSTPWSNDSKGLRLFPFIYYLLIWYFKTKLKNCETLIGVEQ